VAIRFTKFPISYGNPQKRRFTMPAQYLKTSEVKKMAQNLNMRISQQAIIDTNGFVGELLKKAAHRAKKNGRKTVMPHDL
jgi:hypothetical protein